MIRCIVLMLILMTRPALAQPLQVDLQLIAAADISESMTEDIGQLQRQGYAMALRSEQLVQAILYGRTGRIGFAYLEWGDVGRAEIVVPWTVIASLSDANAVAARLERAPDKRLLKTSISHGLAFSASYFAQSGMVGDRVIDVSGNGPNNQGEQITQVRDRLARAGITINGLPIMVETVTPRGTFGTGFDLRELDTYYRNCVVGGPGAFTLPVSSREDLVDAIRLKLLLEVSRAPAPVAVQFAPDMFRFQC